MELTINHLAAYLPYGLQMFNNHNRNVYELSGVYNSNSHSIVNLVYVFKAEASHFDFLKKQFKPLLLPLSGLSHDQLVMVVKHLFRDSEMIRPEYRKGENQIKCEKGFITIYDNNTMQRYTVVKPGSDNLPVLNMSNHFSDYEVFFKLHIDIFDLIKNGLAIDKADKLNILQH